MSQYENKHATGFPGIYPNIVGPSLLSVREMDYLVSLLPDEGIFVEVGSACGATAARVADLKPKLTIISVDTYVDLEHPNIEPHRPAIWRKNRRPNMNLWIGTLSEFRGHAGIRPDAILVDGDHSEQGVTRDLNVAEWFVRSGGIILAHDAEHPEWTGVQMALDAWQPASGFATIGQVDHLRAMRHA